MKRHSKLLLVLLLCIPVVSVSIALLEVFFRNTESPNVPLIPDRVPEIEEQADPIPNDTGEKNETSGKTASVTLTYSDQVTIDLSDKTASLIFANPKKSNHDMVLQIVIQDVVIAQSGRLVSGNQITNLDLADNASEKLEIGGYDGKFVIFYYHQKTGEKAAVNTEIPIAVSVKK